MEKGLLKETIMISKFHLQGGIKVIKEYKTKTEIIVLIEIAGIVTTRKFYSSQAKYKISRRILKRGH